VNPEKKTGNIWRASKTISISGRRAFLGESMMETLSAVVHSEPPTPDSPMAGVVSRCLMKRLDSRFQSAAETHA
jgi:hypothetical protein